MMVLMDGEMMRTMDGVKENAPREEIIYPLVIWKIC